MFNLGGFQPDSDSHAELTRQIIQGMKAAKVDEQIMTILRDAFGKTLEEQNVVLSRPERERLMYKVISVLLTDLLVGIDRPR